MAEIRPVRSVGAAQAAPPKPIHRVLAYCVSVGQAPTAAKVENHACMREEYWARFEEIKDGENSHPVMSFEVRSLTPLPFEWRKTYELLVVDV